VRGIGGRSDLGWEHQVIVMPVGTCCMSELVLARLLAAQYVYAALGQLQRAA
jgi:hypothetical protein